MSFNKNKLIIFFAVLLVSFVAHASRVGEIEEYFIAKTSGILKSRFPEKPFLVFVKVAVADAKDGRAVREFTKGDQTTRIPYLDVDEQSDVDFWSRTDIPLGTLINFVQKINVKIQIDSSVRDEEVFDLKNQLIEQLNLKQGVDTLEIAKRDWTSRDRMDRYLNILYMACAITFLVFLILFTISKLSIRSLIQGISKPISEIGKSTQAFANSALNMVSDKQYSEELNGSANLVESSNENVGLNLLEIRKSGLDLLIRNRSLLSHPDAELMSFIERKGSENPAQMGAILAELDELELKTLFKYGVGNWWYLALAQPRAMSNAALAILNELDRLRLRRHFCENKESSDSHRLFGVALNRLSIDELVDCLQGYDIDVCQPILDLLPKDLTLAVAKRLYPGRWAALLESNKTDFKVDAELLSKIEEKALVKKPLRNESEIKKFFAELDIVKYLDAASLRDEKDFYITLRDDSRIKNERMPFYLIFEGQDEIKKILGPRLSPVDWAHALHGCDDREVMELIKPFNERLQFLIAEEMQKLASHNVDLIKVRTIRRKAVDLFQSIKVVNNLASINVAEKENQDASGSAA